MCLKLHMIVMSLKLLSPKKPHQTPVFIFYFLFKYQISLTSYLFFCYKLHCRQWWFEVAASCLHQRFIITGPFMTDHHISKASRLMGLLLLCPVLFNRLLHSSFAWMESLAMFLSEGVLGAFMNIPGQGSVPLQLWSLKRQIPHGNWLLPHLIRPILFLCTWKSESGVVPNALIVLTGP